MPGITSIRNPPPDMPGITSIRHPPPDMPGITSIRHPPPPPSDMPGEMLMFLCTFWSQG